MTTPPDPINEPALRDPEEDSTCPQCSDGKMVYQEVTNCSCHISPPCWACTGNLLTCDECGWEFHPPHSEERYRHVGGGIAELYQTRPSIELGEGKRIFDFDYDSSSGSTMVYRGRYKGGVTPEDIKKAFGDGTFGHRGPTIENGRFTYTKITD